MALPEIPLPIEHALPPLGPVRAVIAQPAGTEYEAARELFRQAREEGVIMFDDLRALGRQGGSTQLDGVVADLGGSEGAAELGHGGPGFPVVITPHVEHGVDHIGLDSVELTRGLQGALSGQLGWDIRESGPGKLDLTVLRSWKGTQERVGSAGISVSINNISGNLDRSGRSNTIFVLIELQARLTYPDGHQRVVTITGGGAMPYQPDSSNNSLISIPISIGGHRSSIDLQLRSGGGMSQSDAERLAEALAIKQVVALLAKQLDAAVSVNRGAEPPVTPPPFGGRTQHLPQRVDGPRSETRSNTWTTQVVSFETEANRRFIRQNMAAGRPVYIHVTGTNERWFRVVGPVPGSRQQFTIRSRHGRPLENADLRSSVLTTEIPPSGSGADE